MKVLVVGASRGIGREFVRQYLAAGAHVCATARRPSDVSGLQSIGAQAFALDVADAGSAADLGAHLDGTAFDIALVVAGVYGPRTQGLEAPSREDFDTVMHTNVLGAMRVLAQLGDVLAPGARVVVLSSRMGSIGGRSSTHGWLYRASKAALNSLLRDASIAWAGRAVCVAVHPGWVRTAMGGESAPLAPEQSVADLRRLVAGLKDEDNGRFFDHDGQPIAW